MQIGCVNRTELRKIWNLLLLAHSDEVVTNKMFYVTHLNFAQYYIELSYSII